MRASLYNLPLYLAPEAALKLAAETAGASGGEGRGYELRGGVAVIPVRGPMANRKGDAWWGGGSYEGLRDTLDACLGDPLCRAIVLDIDSPGGVVSGAMELAAAIRAASGRKRVVAYVDGIACSAGYALASGASKIFCAPSGMVGSIGVVMVHVDITRMLEGIGIKPTLLQSGAYKTDGTSLKPLDGGAASRIQETLDDHYAHFVDTVGAHRPALGADGARKTEAGLFVGARAVKAGLVDELGDLSSAMRAALAAPTIAPARGNGAQGVGSFSTPSPETIAASAGRRGAQTGDLRMAAKSEEQRGREDFIVAVHGRRQHAPTGLIERGPAASWPTTAEAVAKADADYAAGVAAFRAAMGKV